MRQARGASGVVLRNLWDPVRNLADAVRDMTANLEAEFDAPHTSTLRRADYRAARRSEKPPRPGTSPITAFATEPQNGLCGDWTSGLLVVVSARRRALAGPRLDFYAERHGTTVSRMLRYRSDAMRSRPGSSLSWLAHAVSGAAALPFPTRPSSQRTPFGSDRDQTAWPSWTDARSTLGP